MMIVAAWIALFTSLSGLILLGLQNRHLRAENSELRESLAHTDRQLRLAHALLAADPANTPELALEVTHGAEVGDDA